MRDLPPFRALLGNDPKMARKNGGERDPAEFFFFLSSFVSGQGLKRGEKERERDGGRNSCQECLKF